MRLPFAAACISRLGFRCTRDCIRQAWRPAEARARARLHSNASRSDNRSRSRERIDAQPMRFREINESEINLPTDG